AVDEVEEHDLPQIPPGHHAPGQPPLRSGLLPRVERLGLGPDGRDLVPVREPLRQARHGRESTVRAQPQTSQPTRIPTPSATPNISQPTAISQASRRAPRRIVGSRPWAGAARALDVAPRWPRPPSIRRTSLRTNSS